MFEIENKWLYEVLANRRIKVVEVNLPDKQEIPLTVGLRLALKAFSGAEPILAVEEMMYWYSKCLNNENGAKAFGLLYG